MTAALILMSACASGPTHTDGAANPQAVEMAVQRWEACVDRAASARTDDSGTMIGAVRDRHSENRRARRRCDGYRRDVAAHFPLHLETRVHARLKERERVRLASLSTSPDTIESLARTLNALSEHHRMR